ncbi:MAG: flagellar basal body P-ring formation chaperone FlgA [Rickettsiaceae bacterium]
MHRIFYSVVLIFILQNLFAQSIFADNLIVENITKQLIGENVNHDDKLIEVFYNSSKQLEQVQSKSSIIEDIELQQLDYKNKKFTIYIIFNGLDPVELSGKYNLFINAPIANKLIKAGSVIHYEDISNLKINSERIKNYISDINNIIDMKAKKNISPGAFFKKADLAKLELISANDRINLLFTSNNITIKTYGIALESGALGDKIKVKNENTESILFGYVVDKNTVQIKDK